LIRASLLAAAAALMLWQFADCMSAVLPEQPSMQCCSSVPCTPASQIHDCCDTMVSQRVEMVLPVESTYLTAPQTMMSGHSPLPPDLVRVTVAARASEAPEQSPPELYTLHASLLI